MSENPFRPGITVDPKYFVGREKEIEAFRKSLTQSKYGNSQHVAVMGERGIGKSSLLRKFDAIIDKKEHLVVRRDLDASLTSIEELVNFILTVLKSEGTRDIKGRFADFFKEYSWNVSAAGFGIGIDSKKGVALQELFFNELKRISGNTQSEYASICIMLDEAEHLEGIKGSWSFLRTVFSRLNEEGSHYLLVVAGKLGLFDKIKEIFSPLERFFYPWEISTLSKSEVEEMMSRPFKDMRGGVSEEVIDRIFTLSSGFPYVAQVIGFHLFETGKIRITMKIFEQTWPDILNRLEVQLFKSRYESASPREKEVLRKMADELVSDHSAQELSKALEMSNKQISSIFGHLVRKNGIIKVSLGRFKLFHPLFGEYIKKRHDV